MTIISDLLNDPLAKHRWKAARSNPLRFVKVRLDGYWYDFKRLFSPFNVIKCQHLPRSWCDRDYLMFHAMFQIVVDFVELEHPFRDWCNDQKRYTDRVAMREWIENMYNTEVGRMSFHADWFSDEDKASQDKRTHQTYLTYMEILYLYEWYKDEKYDLDKWDLSVKTGEKIVLGDDGIQFVPNGKPALITRNEYHEMTDEHEVICNNMLHRILAIRRHLWT
jgi:hypothetical protein